MTLCGDFPLTITLKGKTLNRVQSQRHLGIIVQADLMWNTHIQHIESKFARTLHLSRRIRGRLSPTALSALYTTYIRPVIEYGSLAMSAMNVQQQDALERLQRRSAKLCLRLRLFSPCHHSSLLHHITWPTLSSRRKLKQLLFAHTIAVKRTRQTSSLRPQATSPSHQAEN